MKRSDFHYDLPKENIAQYPLEDRESSKLLVLHRHTGAIEHKHFTDITHYLNKDDLLVLNNTKVIPARLFGKKETGGSVEVFLQNELQEGEWEALVRPSARVRKGSVITFSAENFYCHVLDAPGEHTFRRVRFNRAEDFWKKLNTVGTIPLPPYIKRSAEEHDGVTYQTVYARERGAVAAPTAGLHFTPQLLEAIAEKGVEILYITLHIGYGTFRPVKVDDVRTHEMHKEFFEISEAVAHGINQARKAQRRIVACGTTTVRALESAVASEGVVRASRGYTDIFIYPPYTFKMVDALITNFHLPESTLLMLVSAFAGREEILRSYKAAQREKYRFFSYGDAMFIV